MTLLDIHLSAIEEEVLVYYYAQHTGRIMAKPDFDKPAVAAAQSRLLELGYISVAEAKQ